MLPCEHAHRGAAGQEVFHHLPGHVAREGRDATRGQAVVAGEHHELRALELGRFRAEDQTDALGQRLEAAERAERLGLVVQLVLQALGQCGLRDVGDGGKGVGHGRLQGQGWMS
ncbi:hypothetical protein FQZ97_960870 [compost metagenome]